MRVSKSFAPLLTWLLLANAARADALAFKRVALTFPAGTHARTCRFVDVDGDGRPDLLTVDPAENRLLIYRQRASGFENTPDQIIRLPAQTSWIAASDVDAHPGLELVISTATGVVYFRQNAGAFESEPRELIKAAQVATSGGPPFLASLTNDAIPVITPEHVVMYRRNEAFAWNAGEPSSFEAKNVHWSAYRDDWMLGANPSHGMSRREVFLAHPKERLPAAEKAENDFIRKLADRPDRNAWSENDFERADVNGDGREDVILWNVVGGVETKTDVVVFLRGADGRLPEQPAQVLHCRGFPVTTPAGRTSPLCALKGDGKYQLVLAALKTTILSSGGVVDTLVSGSVEWELTVRPFGNGGFTRTPETAAVITTVLSFVEPPGARLRIGGDFNGDGRPDLLAKRSDTQWNLLLSSTNGGWFARAPAAAFEIPAIGTMQMRDLNGDGRSDIVVPADFEPQLLIFLSQTNRAERSSP